MSSQSISLPRLMLLGSVLLLALQLGACGGSSGTTVAAPEAPTDTPDEPTAAPDAPSLSLTPTVVKRFSFSWNDVSGEAEYRLLENPDGTSGYIQVASIAADATGHDLEVFLPRRVNASYILQACNSVGCNDSSELFVSGTLAEAVGYFKGSNTEAGDLFGRYRALSADGNTLAVGAYMEDSAATGLDGDQSDNTASGSGAVYIFTRGDAGTWSQQAYVKASNTGAADYFGQSLTLSADGGTLAVGAYLEDSAATGVDGDDSDNTAADSGAVYLFTRSTTGDWSQQAYVKASNTGAGDYFGRHLALSDDGDTLAVGAVGEDSSATGLGGDQSDNISTNSGAVYLFTRNDVGDWSQQAYVKASNTGAGDYFGRYLALSADGNTLAAGAHLEDSAATGIGGDQSDDAASSGGAVYVFTRSGSSWTQQAYVKASNTEANDRFGIDVALSDDGNTLAVGADAEDSAAAGIDGDQGDNAASLSGAVYVFTRSATTWTQQAYVKASNPEAADWFGRSVALSADGNTLAVGAYREDSAATGLDGDQGDNTATDSGAVYLFTRSDVGTWSQQAYVKASNTGGNDKFGDSVVLSGDGNTLAAGAYSEDSAATGLAGDQSNNDAASSGAVYLY